MSAEPVRCTSCGAPMKLYSVDSRVTACEYCGAQVQTAIDHHQIAQGLALDLADLDSFLDRLAERMTAALDSRARIVRDAGKVVAVEINLDPDLFVVKRDPGGGVTAVYKKLVRGVALKSAPHPLDRWYGMLTTSLARFANENARVALALRRG